MFKIANRMVKTNQDILGEQWIGNDDGYYLLAVIDEDKNKAWKSYHEKLLSTKFA